jgi:PAS domain S-box-containing protein
MPRFFFNFRGPDGLEPDEIGLELPGVDAALWEARRSAPGIFGELIAQGRDLTHCGFEIVNSSGRLVLDIPFTDLLGDGRGSRSFAPRRTLTPWAWGRAHRSHAEMGRAPADLYRQVFATMPEPTVILTLQLKVIGANQAYLEATGIRAESLVDHFVCEVFPRNPDLAEATDAAAMLASFERALAAGGRDEAPPLRYDLRTGDGAWRKRYWRVTSWPIADDTGAVVALANQMRDVTAEIAAGQAG